MPAHDVTISQSAVDDVTDVGLCFMPAVISARVKR